MPLQTFIVQDLKLRLDRYLADQLSSTSRSRVQKDIQDGKVTVNGTTITESNFVVRLNDKIAYDQVEQKDEGLQPTNTPLKVLYNDNGLLIIDKPAGLTVHPGAGFKGETLASALLYQFNDIRLVGEEGRPGIVHRLDKDTSGVMLIATTQDMYEYLKDAFAQRRIKKEYIALVAGRVEKMQGVIDTPIGRSKTDFRKYTTKDPVQAKEAVTEYKVLEYLRSGNKYGELDGYSLLLVKLHTGRTHQIRVHFSSLGHALVGDLLYGDKRSTIDNLNRQFLHAKRIEVRLPNGTWIEAESELPADLKKILIELNSKIVKQLL